MNIDFYGPDRTRLWLWNVLLVKLPVILRALPLSEPWYYVPLLPLHANQELGGGGVNSVDSWEGALLVIKKGSCNFACAFYLRQGLRTPAKTRRFHVPGISFA